MKHDEVIKPEYIQQYVDTHKILYRTLSIMISDVNFLKACVNLQDHDLESDWISIKYLHGTVFESLILRTYKCFFDNSGTDSTNLFKFKNSIIGTFLKDEFREEVKNKITTLRIEDKVYRRAKLEKLEENILCLRDQYIGHGLLNADDATVDLSDIEDLLKLGCELFQALSFEPKRFYGFFEGDGYDFLKEFAYTEKSLTNLVRYTQLSSTNIRSISCDFDSECDESVAVKIQALVHRINDSKKENRIEREMQAAEAITSSHPILNLSPGDLRRAKQSLQDYLSQWDPEEQEFYRDYYEDVLA